MRKLQTSDRPAGRLLAAALCLAAPLASLACSSNDIPPELRRLVDSRLPRAVNLAEAAATRCAAYREAGGPAPTVSPAVGTSLAEELEVVEILVRCDWQARGDAASDDGERSYSFPPLRQAAPPIRSISPKLMYDTSRKRGDGSLERVHAPSRFSEAPMSADILAIRPIPGGGTVEVLVATVKR